MKAKLPYHDSQSLDPSCVSMRKGLKRMVLWRLVCVHCQAWDAQSKAPPDRGKWRKSHPTTWKAILGYATGDCL